MPTKKQEQGSIDDVERVLLLLGRLTVLRSFSLQKPVKHLVSLCDAIAAGDAMEATYEYHAMTAALIEAPSRRVTGNVWRDFVFSQLLETPNHFSELAAMGKSDPPVTEGMKHDLRLMQELFKLNGKDWIAQIGSLSQKTQPERAARERSNEQRAQREERIARLSSVAWGSNGMNVWDEENRNHSSIKLPVKAELPHELELSNWIGWDYHEPAEPVEYAADEALALVYRCFLGEEQGDWGSLIDALHEFHMHYGAGDFLRYHTFVAMDEGLFGLQDANVPEWDQLVGLERQKEMFYANVLRFIHTGKAQNTLLYGCENTGKTSLALAMANEMPELRLVFLGQQDDRVVMESIIALSRQPFYFLALIDDIQIGEPLYARLKRSSPLLRGIKNVLLVATSCNELSDPSLFGLQIEFPMPSFEEFCQYVLEFVRNRHGRTSRGAIRENCEEYAQNNDDFSTRAAFLLAEQMVRNEQH